jgi:uncharacterized protein (TIGR03437 family)
LHDRIFPAPICVYEPIASRSRHGYTIAYCWSVPRPFAHPQSSKSWLEISVKNFGRSLSSLGLLLLALISIFDAARAQNNLIANPSQLTFNTQSGVTTNSQNISLTSSTPVSVAASATSAGNWLLVSPSNGVTPLTLFVSIGSGAPKAGTGVGFVNVNSSAGSVNIHVTLNANSPGPSPLSASPNALSFIFGYSSTGAATQSISVSSSSPSVNAFTATAALSSGADWLTVNPGSGAVPGSFNVTVRPTALPTVPSSAGTFEAAIAINAPGAPGIVVPVLVTELGIPSIIVSPSQLSFGYQLGTTAPATQTLSLSSNTGATLGFSAYANTTTCGTGWLVLSSGFYSATPSTLTVSVNISELTAGPACKGEIDISDARGSPIVIPVSLLVSNSPLIQVPSPGPTFNFQIGGTTPTAQNVQITSTTTGISFTATATAASGAPNFLEVFPASGTTPQALSLTLNPTVLATLANGTYTENVSIAPTGAGNSPQAFPVTLLVASNPILTSTAPVPNGLTFDYQIGQPTPANQTVTMTSSGAPLNYLVSTNTTNCGGFLTATPTSGSTFGNQNQIVVGVTTTGLTIPEVCNGNVVMTVPGASTSLQIPVTLNVSNSVLLNVGQSAISVTALAGSTTPIQQPISVTSTDNSIQTFNATASTNPAGLKWLSVAPNSGSTPQDLQVTINPTGLAAGVYNGSITIHGTGSASSAPIQTIPVILTILLSGTVTAYPASLNFTQSVGALTAGSQTLYINGIPIGTMIGALPTFFNGTGTWLTTSVSGSVVTVSANGSQLTQGTYDGVVTVIVPGTQSPLNIPVTLTVGASVTLSVSPATVNFSFQLGTSVVFLGQVVQVTSTGNVPFSVTFSPNTGGDFVIVSPTSGNTPATLSLVLNAVATLSPGSYSGKIIVSSPAIPGGDQTVAVNLTITPGPPPVITSIENAASFQPGPIAPGEIITIFGTSIGPAAPASGTGFQSTANGTVPTTLAGATVAFNNVNSPLLFVSPNQINAVVPYEVASSSTANVTVQINGLRSAAFAAQVVATSPAIFALTQIGSGQGAILNQDNTVNGAAHPAAKGSIIQIFGTGEGQLVPGVSTGCITGLTVFPKPAATPVTVTIGGQSATPITYAGEAPEEVCGVIQINATVPANIASGTQPVVLTIGSNTNSQQNITVSVQ